MRPALAALFLLFFACKGADPVPRDTQMWRIEGEWKDAGNSIRTARATIIAFRSSKEFVEVHTSVIERPDGTVYIMARAPRTAAVGQWEQRRSKVEVIRKKVVDLPCGTVTFQVTGKSVLDSFGTYSPITRLVAPEFETFVNATKQKGSSCGEP